MTKESLVDKRSIIQLELDIISLTFFTKHPASPDRVRS